MSCHAADLGLSEIFCQCFVNNESSRCSAIVYYHQPSLLYRVLGGFFLQSRSGVVPDSRPYIRSIGLCICQWRIQDLPKGGTMASAQSASLNGGLGVEPSAGSRGRAPGGGSGGRSPPEAESFFYIFTQKKWPKVKDLSENLPPCLSRAAKASPTFWSIRGGGAAALTAHSWIRHWYLCVQSSQKSSRVDRVVLSFRERFETTRFDIFWSSICAPSY